MRKELITKRLKQAARVFKSYDTSDGRRTFGVVFPILKGGNSAFIAAIASGFFPQTEYRSLKYLRHKCGQKQ